MDNLSLCGNFPTIKNNGLGYSRKNLARQDTTQRQIPLPKDVQRELDCLRGFDNIFDLTTFDKFGKQVELSFEDLS